MAVRAVRNLYLGVNAHLHSQWQAERSWNRFHNAYLTYLLQNLRAQLLPIGYTAELEESLQIRRVDSPYPRAFRSDILVFDREPRRTTPTLTLEPDLEVTVADLIEPEDRAHPYAAVGVYEVTAERRAGDPVAWIEVLSPTNKGQTDDAVTYVGKRRMLLDGGIVFVELDFLHETPPTFPRLLNYADPAEREAGAQPYRIVVLDPRPELTRGPAQVREFAVDEVCPLVDVPLQRGDRIVLDAAQPYRRLFDDLLYGYGVDYAELPPRFETYSRADQTRIARRMLAAVTAAAAGQDLETAPLPIEAVSLDEALARIESLKAQLTP